MKSILLPLSLAMAGCVANDLNLTIEHYLFADPAAACVVTPTSMVLETSGLLDVGIVANTGVPGYTVFPVIANHLPLQTNTTTDVDRRSILLKGVNVELLPDASLASAIAPAQRKFFVPLGAGRLDAQGSIALGVEVVPRAIAIALANSVQVGVGNAFPRVVANVSPVGDYSGDTVIGAPVAFPIEVCKYCLSGGSPQACPNGGFLATSVQQGGCISSQDLPVTCCVANQMQLVCGAQVPTKTM